MKSDDEITSEAGQQAAADYLRQLLLKPGPYREMWRGYVLRPREGVINQLAVAEVLALSQRMRGDRGADASKLRELVFLGLAGKQLGRQALQLFMDGFRFTDDDSRRAWRLWGGATNIRVIAGTRAVPDPDERTVSQILGPRRHQLLSLRDHIGISAVGLVESIHVVEVVEALANDVDRIPFLTSTDVMTLEVGQGCRDIAGEIRQVTETLYLTHFLLARTLELGETLTVEYWVTWPAGSVSPENPRDREYRRGVMGQVTSYDARIEFHPDLLPTKLWWATWDGVEGVLLSHEEVALDTQRSAHRYLSSIKKAAVGFYWTLPERRPGSVPSDQVRYGRTRDRVTPR
jgi:hypothetical protein